MMSSGSPLSGRVGRSRTILVSGRTPQGREAAMVLIIALLALLVGAIVFGAFWVFFGSTTSQEVVRDRMDAVRRAEKRGDVSLDLQLVRDEMMSSVPLLNRIMMKLGWTTGLQNFIHAGRHGDEGRQDSARFAVSADFPPM